MSLTWLHFYAPPSANPPPKKYFLHYLMFFPLNYQGFHQPVCLQKIVHAYKNPATEFPS